MSDKPSYLGLLNGIALAEANAHCYLEAWIATTDHPGVKETLSTVSWREGEHGMAFAKRISELGFSLRRKEDARAEKAMAIATSDIPDVEKFRKLGLDKLGEGLSFFDNIFADHTIDIRTGELLGRYIAEEFDSTCRLRACYDQLVAEERRGHRGTDDDRIDALAGQVDALCQAVEDLRAELVPAAGSNGKSNGRTVAKRR